ncbi:hypothetical protein D3C87_1674970 [compost metagenome]
MSGKIEPGALCLVVGGHFSLGKRNIGKTVTLVQRVDPSLGITINGRRTTYGYCESWFVTGDGLHGVDFSGASPKPMVADWCLIPTMFLMPLQDDGFTEELRRERRTDNLRLSA